MIEYKSINDKLADMNTPLSLHIRDWLGSTDLRMGADLLRFDKNDNEFVSKVALRIVKRVWENLQKKRSTPLKQTYWESIDDSCLVPYLFEKSTIEVAMSLWDIVQCYSDEEIEKIWEVI